MDNNNHNDNQHHDISINDILNILPHRYPFLMIDKVLHINPNQSIKGIKNVTFNEPHFMGHFPDKPVMPGVLIIESMAQLSAILVAQSLNSLDNKEVYFMSITDTKFRQIVMPGDQLIIEANMLQNRGNVWKFASKAFVDSNIVAESVFTAMVKEKESLK